MIRQVATHALLAMALLAAAGTASAGAQEVPPSAASGWNGPRAMDLVARARDRRQEPLADTTLRNYRADATGHIYFFLDREQAGEPVLLRADQVALELYWAQPDQTKQVIRGMRSEEQLPIRNFAYYLDRYTVIQNGFGDEIRVGEGRDVADVPHPLAPGPPAVYDYRLADSLTLSLPGRTEPLRVYEVQVRPRDFSVPAIVGSLFIERARGDLVRLAFTFTPSAYLDDRNERVEVVLENALWEDRYWLPREQRLLVRREIPELDVDVGTVIRAVLRVDDITLNAAIPRGFFAGPEVIAAAGPEGLARYEFDEGLYEGLDDVGLTPGAEPGTLDAVDVEAIAGRILRERFLRGIPRLRLYAPGASSVVRYDRAEGLVTGAGLGYGIGEHQLTAYGARAWGAEQFIAEVAVRPLSGRSGGWLAEAYWNRPVDLGLRPAAAGVVSSIAAAAFGEDYRDLYYERGVAVGVGFDWWWLENARLVLSAERHDSARLAVAESPFLDGGPFRPVFAIEEGRQIALALSGRHRREARWGGTAEVSWAVEFGALDRDLGSAAGFYTARVDMLTGWRGRSLDWGIERRATFYTAFGSVDQHGVLVGGRGTLPGHPFRGYYSRDAILADVEGWVAVLPRWLRLRATAGGGVLKVVREEPRPVPPLTHLTGGDELVGSLGLGLGFIDGILRLDHAWGFGADADGSGVWILSVDPRLWDFL